MSIEERKRREAYMERRRRKKKKRTIQIVKRSALTCIGVLLVLFIITRVFHKEEAPQEVQAEKTQSVTQTAHETKKEKKEEPGFLQKVISETPDYQVDLLTPNPYSRPQEALKKVKGIVVHYTANPGTTAAQNRSYFEQQKDTHENSVSAHFIIGYEGEIIQCVPLDEIAYAVMTRNFDSISIECCYLARDGSFTQETYDSLVSLLAWLIDVYDLDTEDILRHYDCGGKKCPLYYTNNPGEWEQLKKDVDNL